jgi:glycerate dehydrogenase
MKFKKITVLEPNHSLENRKSELIKFCEEIVFFEESPIGDLEITRRLKDSDAIILTKTPLSKEVIDSIPNLKYICVGATDCSFLDIDYIRTKNVVISNTRDYCSEEISEFVLGQLIRYYRKLDDFSINSRWSDREDYLGQSLNKKIIGIIGLGNIGLEIAKKADSLGMSVIYNSKSPKCVSWKFMNLNDLLIKSDVVIISAKLTKETNNLLNMTNLSLMKPDSVIINIARGKIMDYDALFKLIKNDKIGFAILDVFPDEPFVLNDSNLNKKVFMTPHIAWKTESSIKKLGDEVINNIRSYLNGEERNIVN